MIVISPVMARSLRTGRPVRAETIPVTMVIPADGPSLGMPIIVARTAMSKLLLPVVRQADLLGVGPDELGGGGNALLHHLLHRAEADDPARTLRCLHLEMEQASSIVADDSQPDDLADSR